MRKYWCIWKERSRSNYRQKSWAKRFVKRVFRAIKRTGAAAGRGCTGLFMPMKPTFLPVASQQCREAAKQWSREPESESFFFQKLPYFSCASCVTAYNSLINSRKTCTRLTKQKLCATCVSCADCITAQLGRTRWKRKVVRIKTLISKSLEQGAQETQLNSPKSFKNVFL